MTSEVVPDTGTTPLPELTGFLLRRAYVKATACTTACISADADIQDVHIREVAILAIVAEMGSLSQRQVSDITQVNRTLVVKLVDSLEERGWVIRERKAADRRSYALRLTLTGEHALAHARRDLERGEQALVERLDDEQRARLRRHLLTLLDHEEWLAIELLSHQTGFLIARAHRQVRAWAVELLQPLGLDPRDFGVLVTIQREQPCTQKHLASQLGVTPAAALTFVEELEGVGLVNRDRNQADRRFYDLTLTSAGRHRLGQAGRAVSDVQARIRTRLGATADDDLRALLSRLVEL